MGGVAQSLPYKRPQQQLYFGDEQTLIPVQRIYFEINKSNKYISTDIVQISLCIVELKT